MINVKIAIVDDELNDYQNVVNYFENKKEQINYKFVHFSTYNEQLFDNYDVYFLDIELDNENGLNIGEKIREKYPNAIIVIYSKRNDLVFESFRLGCFYFVRKDSFDKDIQYLYQCMSQHFYKIKKTYLYDSKGILKEIKHENILYIEKINHNVEIHLDTKEVLCERKTINKILNDLNSNLFIQCHQSYIVNLSKIERLYQNDFIVNEYKIPISKRHYSTARQQFLNYLSEKV